ncbi:MAG: type III secretion system outer membrane ring subunit SctC [Ramlibacter sp.]
MKLNLFSRRLRTAAAAGLIACTPVAFGAEPPWPADAQYSYFANAAPLGAVLADFATGFSLSLSVQPDVAGTVNGRFATSSPTEYISKLASVYGFVWYTHAGTLFVSRASDVVTKGIAAPGGNVASMRKALADLGVLEPRFGWGELAEHGMAIVSGPPSYIQLVENTIRNLPARAQQLSVIRLKHASAQDRTVPYRDQQLVIPGLATLLRGMVSGVVAIAPSGTGSAPSAGLQPLPPLGTQAAAPPAAGVRPGTAAPQTGTQPNIQAEPRLNALIIQDVPERMPLYQQLIEQLDVPTAQVEIEAMIVDISTDSASELGVSWSGRVGRLDFSLGRQTELTGASNSARAGNFLMAQLRALETKGDAEIMSRPSVLTSDNMAALLDLSETFYIRSQGERVANVTPVTAGTTLRVTPHVVQLDGKMLVQLKIDIEDGRISGRQVDSLPTVGRTSISTEATVDNGDALLIAGYVSTNDLASRDQVPVLGDIPGVGVLFSTRSRTVQKRERMFLIRPRVVGWPGQAPLGRPVAAEPTPRAPGAQ